MSLTSQLPKTRSKHALFIATLFTAATPLQQAVAETSHVEISAIDWCPFICPKTPEKPGILVEYTKEIFSRSGIEVKHRIYTWPRAVQNVKSGRSDAVLAPAKAEAPDLIYPETRIGAQRFCFFTPASSNWVYNGPESLKNIKVVYPRDTLTPSIEGSVNKNLSRELPYSGTFIHRGLKSILAGKADTLYLTYYSTLDHLKQTQQFDKIRLAGCVEKADLYLAFSPNPKNSERNKQLISAFESGISALSDKKFIRSLLKKYNLNAGFQFQNKAIASPWE